MKTQITALFTLLLMLLSYSTNAQKGTVPNVQQQTDLIKTWYESPKESSGDTIVFRLNKYVLVPGVDNPAFEFSQLIFKNSVNFTIGYWRWCKMAQPSYNGIWKLITETNISLDFGEQKCKNELIIIDLKADRLKTVIKETAN